MIRLVRVRADHAASNEGSALKHEGVVMRIALAFGLCLIAAAAAAGPRAKDLPKPETGVTPANVRENFRARMNENVVTIMAGSPSGTDLAIVQDIASVLDDGDRLRV